MQSVVYQANPVYSAGSRLSLVPYPQQRWHDQRRGLSCRLLCCGPAGKQVEQEETAGSMFTGMEEEEKEKEKEPVVSMFTVQSHSMILEVFSQH